MKTNRPPIFLIILLVVFLATLAFFLLQPHEPIYQGRPLSSWLRQLNDGKSNPNNLLWQTWSIQRTPAQAQAADAIQHIGTNALPYLLNDITNDAPISLPTLRTKANKLLAKYTWLKLPTPAPGEAQQAAILAFDALGPVASPALPELTKAFNAPALYFPKGPASALASIGPPGWDALIKAVPSTNVLISTCATWSLASHHIPVPEGVIDLLTNQVANSTSANGALVAWALSELSQDAEKLLPVLTKSLQSTDMPTRWGSAMALGNLGTNAVSAVPALLNAMTNTDATTAQYAKTALQKIQPEAAVK